jgi:hypothetical protein
MLMVPERLTHPEKVAYRLSKSKFLSGLQCHKRLYLEIYHPELATEPDETTQALLDRGTAIGALARQRFPGGILVEADREHALRALDHTKALLADPRVPAIFEGAFLFDNVFIRVDILERISAGKNGDSIWRLIEVKSSSRVKEVHLDDLAIQTYVIGGSGLILAQICLMHINTQYVYPGGELDVQQFFTVHDCTELVQMRLADVPSKLSEMKAMLADPTPPTIEPDGHCFSPYECPFWEHCTREKPERWIYHLPGGDNTVRQLVSLGIQTIDDIPSDFNLTVWQRRVKENTEWVSPKLGLLLKTVRYPVHHLDFETFMPAIPKFPNTRPYQMIPIQWSNHVEYEDGRLEHDQYLSMDAKDPREELAVRLLESLGREGSICVYSDYERTVIGRLAEALPLLRQELLRLLGRLWDLHLIVRDHYYHPAFKGSYSIKTVLPAVTNLSYDDLDIRDGECAARVYERMVFEETDWVEKLRLREALLKYCARDTLALVELRKALARKSQGA